AVQHLTLPAADVVILLDLSRHVCFWRVIRRWWWHRGTTRPDVGEGCPDKIDLEFLQWIWGFGRNSLPAVMERLSRLREDQRVIIVKRPSDVPRLVESLRKERELCSA